MIVLTSLQLILMTNNPMLSLLAEDVKHLHSASQYLFKWNSQGMQTLHCYLHPSIVCLCTHYLPIKYDWKSLKNNDTYLTTFF